jgi:hypothetical protein
MHQNRLHGKEHSPEWKKPTLKIIPIFATDFCLPINVNKSCIMLEEKVHEKNNIEMCKS